MSVVNHLGETWQIVPLALAAVAPWRNGGGSTRELVTWPGGGDWAWRLSVADVERDGPFSAFDGVARWFAVLEGAGVRLDVAGQPHVLTADSAPLAFDGGVATGCTLIDGPTRDFNLMTVRGRAHAQMRRIAGHGEAAPTQACIVAVFVQAQGGAVMLTPHAAASLAPLPLVPHSLAWRKLAAGDVLRIDAAAALLMEITIEGPGS